MSSEVARIFDAMAPAYGTLEPWYEHLYAVLHAILRRELRPPADGRRGRALDAGCGTGFQAARLAALGWDVHGVDIAAALLAVARAELPRAALARASLEALPYPAGAFDAVACCGSTLSFVDDPARALGELARVLRPGGRLLLECEHTWNLDLGWAALSALARDALGYGVSLRDVRGVLRDGVWPAYPGYGRLRTFTLGELGALLRTAGLAPERRWGIHAVTNLIPSTVLHRARLGRPLAVLYRALRAVDEALAPVAARGANSVVLLARKAAPPQ
ncbi:MAG: hypothetical protein A3I14_16370 [Candidatus Rokubacteria bacterium RIFCSPLOWO2_02_FULL_73_56]|nr:MAG: hypothetical protein A3D33_05170 [Candidatus Rokubacteria bacterium RIFCSPHIGHO2_02_FULL_73_26]OGL12554.1 MAG: hypothetical protein A3I14_16370 [Candidatus Rokubacteria bacterium RIFCSPLOWO2_02_FULL_73_56]OGL27091.1 MAG: hypothetical protein A3G44_02285 [Candidatus Rokubacteria bacterium RIFCSPLOWO2_12_FULL_73_47]